MNVEKDKLIVMMAKVFKEFMTFSGLTWDSAYFRFVRRGEGHKSIQWSYLYQRELKMASSKDVDQELADKYKKVLVDLMQELIFELDKDSGKVPIVVVLKITTEGHYDVKFDYTDTNALEINLIRLCLEDSYFTLQDVDVPEKIKELQRKMAESE